MDSPSNAPRTARARARIELTRSIKDAARQQLAEVGAASLSVRAVARELDMASSAVYRYFPGRDELLTALIADAYGDVADVAQAAAEKTVGQPFSDRWIAVAGSIRRWAIENRHDYALIYGSPVPSYAAPQETAEPAQRLTSAMLTLLVDADSNGELGAGSGSGAKLPPSVGVAFDRIRDLAGARLSDDVLCRGVAGWTQLFGHLSFEMFGQFHTVVDDYDMFFDTLMRDVAARVVAG